MSSQAKSSFTSPVIRNVLEGTSEHQSAYGFTVDFNVSLFIIK